MEDDRMWLLQRNSELEGLVEMLRAQLDQPLQRFSVPPKVSSASRSDSDAEIGIEIFSTEQALQAEVAKLERTIATLKLELRHRQKSHQSLQEREARYRSMLDAMHEGVLLLDGTGAIATCNTSAEEILESSAQDLLDRTITDLDWQLIHEDGSPFDWCDFPGLLTARTGIACSDVVLGICKPEKQVIWLSMNSRPLFQADQVLPSAVVVSFSDISSRKWIEAERNQLLEREQISRAEAEIAREQITQVLQSITDGFVAFDRASRFTYVNHEASRMLGRPARDLLGKVLWEELPRFSDTSFGRIYRRAMAEGVPLEIVDYYEPRNSWYSVRAYPSKSGVSLYCRNITDSIQTVQERDRAQEALKGALQRLSFHVDNSPFAVIEWDRDLQITRWSREAETLLGWSAQEVLGKRFGSWDFVVPEDLELVDRTIAALLNGQQTRNVCNNRNYAKDGSIVHCEWYNSVLFDETGELISVLSLVLNVGDRRTAEEELRESEERFRQLAENIQQVFWMYDVAEHHLIYISPACLQVLGYASESCYEKTLSFWLRQVRQEDLPLVMQSSRKALRGQPVEVTFRFNKLGQERWLLIRAFPVRDRDNRIYRIAGIAEDITERKERERRLRLLESVIVNANDAVVITEAEPVEPPGPKIIYVNEAFTRMLGYKPEEVIGKTPRILQGPKTDWNVLKQIRTALKEWTPAIAELVNYHKDGSEVWIELSIFPVTDQTGHYTYWVGLQREITHRKAAEAEMQKALAKERELSELKSSFVTTVSHEFRTPLSTILSSADMLEFYAGNCSAEKQLEHVQRIQTAAINMKEMLSDVLMLERAEAKKVKFEPEPFNLLSFCTELAEEMRLNDQNNHCLIFEQQTPQITTQAYMDGRLLRQIFTNLLSNALKYSPKASTVYFRLRCDEEFAYFEVQDEGIGIPASDQGRLFEAFHRGTNVGMISGNGLGLAIVKQSVEVHQGKIEVTSRENQGTIARVTLPLQAHPLASE